MASYGGWQMELAWALGPGPTAFLQKPLIVPNVTLSPQQQHPRPYFLGLHYPIWLSLDYMAISM